MGGSKPIRTLFEFRNPYGKMDSPLYNIDLHVELFIDFENLVMHVCSFGCNSVTAPILNTSITLLGREKVVRMSI